VRGGATIIISKPLRAEVRQKECDKQSLADGYVRYVIAKHVHGEIGHMRERRQRNHFERAGLVEGNDPNRFQIDFALTHGGF
jgi:hypothetical protein